MQELAKIEIRSKDPGKPLTGANAVLLIDGVEQKGVTRFSLVVDAGGMAKATIDYIGDFVVSNVIGEMEQIYRPLVPKKQEQKCPHDCCGQCQETDPAESTCEHSCSNPDCKGYDGSL